MTQQSQTLTKKIESARVDIAQYPRLQAFAESMADACRTALTGASHAPTIIGKINAAMSEGARLFADMNERTPMYQAKQPAPAMSIYVSMAPRLAAPLGEALLGGPFEMSDDEPAPTTLDIALTRAVVEELLTSIMGKTDGLTSNAPPRVDMIAPGDAADASSDIMFFNFAFDVSIGEAEISRAITLHLPVALIENQGLLKYGAAQKTPDSAPSRWRMDLEAAVSNAAVELDIILDRYKASLSDLANLEIGQLIPLKENAESALDITLNTNSGLCSIGDGQLGVFADVKAVKILSLKTPVAIA